MICRPPTTDIRLKMHKIRLNSDSFLAKNQTKIRLILTENQTKIKNWTDNDVVTENESKMKSYVSNSQA